MNIWDKVQLAKIHYHSGVFSRHDYIVALGHLFIEATANREAQR